MLNKQNVQISGRRKSEIKDSPGEVVRDYIIKAGLKTAHEAGYAAGNKTEVLVELAQKTGGIVDSGTALIGGGESASAFGRIAFKTTQDIAWGILYVQDFALSQEHAKQLLWVAQH